MNSLHIAHAPDVYFPGLGIEIENLPSGIMLPINGGFEIKLYGIIIGCGILMGYLMACQFGKREKISSDTVVDFLIYGLIFGIIGARLYYVAFEWKNYVNDPIQILNLRGGGLAIYGGVIGGFTTLYVFTKIKKISFFKMADICSPGLVVGQLMGRWGNFFNMEAFGGYSTNILRMCLKKSEVYSGYITSELAENTLTYQGTDYISVHPTFLYESLWNCGVLICLALIHRHKKFDGNVFWAYLGLYGLGRVWIEGLRTDQLIIGNTGIPVSQLLSGSLVVVSAAVTVYQISKKKKTEAVAASHNE